MTTDDAVVHNHMLTKPDKVVEICALYRLKLPILGSKAN